MDVSHKLLRLFLPIVIIGALGIGILDSILTPSPVLAYRHADELEHVDDYGNSQRQYGVAPYVVLLGIVLPIAFLTMKVHYYSKVRTGGISSNKGFFIRYATVIIFIVAFLFFSWSFD